MRMCSIVFLLQLLVATAPAFGQTTGDTSANSDGRLSRWLDLQAGNVALDYKGTANLRDWYYQLQYRFLTKGLFRLDQKGRYGVGFRVSTGNYFTFSWNNTAAGRDDFEGDVYLKELYVSASPWKRLEIQFGGGGINRGESTEITSYSNNGYLMGERVTLRYAEKLFFDEITATGGYLGDPYQPGVFQRIHRLGSGIA